MRLYEAIYVRKSVRKFELTSIDQKRMNLLSRFIQSVHPLFPDIEYKIEILQLHNKDNCIKSGFYVKAPYYLIFYSRDTEEAAQNAGYILEQIVLYLTSKGIGSCYQGSVHVKTSAEQKRTGIIPLMVVAFGYGRDKVWREANEASRLKMEELVSFRETAGDAISTILQAGRLAPSRINSQPWRFMAYKKKIQIFQKKTRRRFLITPWAGSVDMGIVICHLMLGAEELWMDTKFEKTESFSEKELKNYRYIGTMRL